MKLFDLNPVAVKEFRQLTRSRQIRNALVAFLALQIVVAMIVINVMRDGGTGVLTHSETGKRMFAFMSVLLNLATMAALPGNVFWRMMSENRLGKTDPLLATTLTTSQFVNGKLFSGIAMILFFTSASLPFLTLSYLLRGISVAVILQYVFIAFAIACVVIHVAVMLASLRLPDALRKVLFFVFVSGSASYILPLPFLATEVFDEIDQVWTFFISASAAAVAACLALRALAISQLAPPHTDRAAQLRVTTAVVAVAAMAVTCTFAVVHGDDDWYDAGAALTLFGALALLFMECSAAPGIARRALIERPKSGFKRFLRFPLVTGSVPGIFHALFLYALSLIVFQLAYEFDDTKSLVAVTLHASVFLLLARALWNLVLKRFGFNVKFVGALGLAVYLLAILLDLFPRDLDIDKMPLVHKHRDYTLALISGAVGMLVAIALNLPETLAAVRTYFGSGEPEKR